MKNRIIIVLLCVFAMAFSRAAAAGYYVGLSLLDTESEFMEEEDGDSGYEVRFGYAVNDYVSVEADYLDLGSWEMLNISDGGGSLDTEGYGINVLGTYPINDFKLIGKVGGLWWDRDGWLGSIAGPVSFSDDGSDILLGVGVSYKINDQFEVKVEFNESEDFEWSALGLNYRF